MASLQVRELPENIYRRLLELAQIEHRSLAQQAVAVLAKGLSLEDSFQDRRKALINQIRANPLLKSNGITSDPVKLIRQDRSR